MMLSLTGTGQSSADVLGTPGSVLAEKLAGHLVREIILRGSRGGPLAPLAGQLNHDVTHLQGQRLEGLLARLADQVRVLAWAASGPQSRLLLRWAAAIRIVRCAGGRRCSMSSPGHGGRDPDAAGVQVLYGLGGCGKTSIALELVARVREQAESPVETWWVSAADSRQFQAGMIALTFRLGVTEEQIRHGDAADLLWQRLAARSGRLAAGDRQR